MTPSELVANQDRQLRLARHQLASDRANRRDRELRYGNNQKHPAGLHVYSGHVQRVRHMRRRKHVRATYQRRQRQQPSALAQLLAAVGIVVIAAVVLHHLAAYS